MGGKIMFENKLDQLFREPFGRSKYAFGRNFRTLGVWLANTPVGMSQVFTFLICIILLTHHGNTKIHTASVRLWFKDNILVIPGMKMVAVCPPLLYSSQSALSYNARFANLHCRRPVFSKVTITRKTVNNNDRQQLFGCE